MIIRKSTVSNSVLLPLKKLANFSKIFKASEIPSACLWSVTREMYFSNQYCINHTCLEFIDQALINGNTQILENILMTCEEHENSST